jgi:hypothetical protein
MKGPRIARLVRPLLFLVALTLAAAPALAQEGNATTDTPAGDAGGGTAGNGTEGGATGPQPVTFTLVPLNVGGDWMWALEGQTRPNPPLVVQPGAQVTLIIKQNEASAGTPHNLEVGTAPKQKTPNIVDPGDTETLTFTAPATAGTLAYVCLIHAGSMKGTIQIRTADAGGGGAASGEWEEFEGPTVTLGDVVSGVSADCASRPVPAIVADGVIGGPVPSDYAERCENPNAASETPVRAAHAADWVIPLSWALIGLGIVGVVWVHKFYKP